MPRKPPPKVAAAVAEHCPCATDAMLDEIEDQIDARLTLHESKIPAMLASDDGRTMLKMISAVLRAMRSERDELRRSLDIAHMQAAASHRIELSLYKKAIVALLDNDHELAESLGAVIRAIARTTR